MSPRNRKASRCSSKAAARRHPATSTRGPRWRVILPLLLVAVAALAGAVVLLFGRSGGEPGPPRAAIVDQLSLTFPNPDFAETATELMEQAGYTVDYYPGEQVTIEFYRNLPSHGYELILFRTHSALIEDPEGVLPETRRRFEEELRALEDSVFLFTSEPYSFTRHREGQFGLSLVPARYYGGDPEFKRYFAIAPEFIESRMEGRFADATAVLMGCDGLAFDRTAEALVGRGAEAVVGWTGRVSAEHTDAVTQELLTRLLVDKLPLAEAVERAMSEVGPDPASGSVLRLYPSEEVASAIP